MTTELHEPPMLKNLSSNELASKLTELRQRERMGLLEFLWYLAEFERRRVHEDIAYSSSFDYCMRALGMTRSTAYRRTTSARLLARFPIAAQYLSDGRLCETTLSQLKDLLTPENHRELFDRAAGKTEDEVARLVVELQPREVKKDSIRALPMRPLPAQVAAPLLDLAPTSASTPELTPATPAPVAPPPRPKVEPVTPTLTSIRTGERWFRAGTEEAESLHPGGSTSRGLGTGRRALHLCGAGRSPVRVEAPAGVRPHRPARAGWRSHSGHGAAALPAAQPPLGAASLR